MKEYALLTNSTYLYLLQHKYEKINYMTIGNSLGIHRNTVSREYKDFCNVPNWDTLFPITNFYNEENNKNLRAVKILRDIRPDITGITDIANALGISTKTLYNLHLTSFKLNEPTSCVYSITYQGEIIYIGATNNFEQRKRQHLSAISDKKTTSRLYAYCTKNNISSKDLDIRPLILEKELSVFNVENTIINLL